MANPDLHQHDLSPAAAISFVATAGVRKRDEVVEVGAGTGNLTAALLATGCTVHALEIDDERAEHLRQRFAAELASNQLTLLVGDARYHHPQIAGDTWRIVANPPFKHTATFCRRWLLEDLPSGMPQAIDLVMQAQAAEKFCAGERWTRMSLLWHLTGSPQITKKIERDAVTPPSHVPLAGWSWKQQAACPATDELRRIDELVEHCFAGAQGMRQALRGIATPAIIKRQAAAHGWQPDGHPTSLSPAAWRSLTAFLHQLGKL